MTKKNTTDQYTPVTPLQQQTEDNSLNIQLMQRDFNYMKEGVDDIKLTIEKGFNKIEQSFVELKKEIKDGYATKEQLDSVKEDIADLQDLRKWSSRLVIGTIFTTLIGAIIWLLQRGV